MIKNHNHTMNYLLKIFLIKTTINSILLLLHKSTMPLHFVSEKNDKMDKLIEQNDLYILNKDSISKYYIYEDPGRPVVNDVFYSLHDLILEILSKKFFKEIVMRSIQLANNPKLTTNAKLKEHLRHCNNIYSGNIDNIMALFISEYFYNNMYRMIDRYINSFLVQKINKIIFPKSYISKSSLIGDWEDGLTKRTYKGNECIVTSYQDNGSKIVRKGSLTNLLSKDANMLVVYNGSDRRVFKRIDMKESITSR